jgi:hypothetical protein
MDAERRADVPSSSPTFWSNTHQLVPFFWWLGFLVSHTPSFVSGNTRSVQPIWSCLGRSQRHEPGSALFPVFFSLLLVINSPSPKRRAAVLVEMTGGGERLSGWGGLDIITDYAWLNAFDAKTPTTFFISSTMGEYNKNSTHGVGFGEAQEGQ